MPVDEGLVLIPGQQPRTCAEVMVAPDSIVESNETFTISVTTDLPGVNFGSSEAIITIIDNDGRSS